MRKDSLTSANKRDALKGVIESLVFIMEGSSGKGSDLYVSASRISQRWRSNYFNQKPYGNISPAEVVMLMDQERASNPEFAELTGVARIVGRSLTQVAYNVNLERKDELLRLVE